MGYISKEYTVPDASVIVPTINLSGAQGQVVAVEDLDEIDGNYEYDNYSINSYGGGSGYHDDRSVLSAMSNRPNSMHSGKGYLISKNVARNGLSRDSKGLVGSEPGHYLLYRNINGSRFNIEMYMTKNKPGTIIRHAVSGIREKNMRTGRRDEDAYFKVAYSIGECVQDRYGNLYYNSPEEYERHFHTTVSQQIKEKWLNRNMEYQKQLMKENMNYDTGDMAETYVLIH
uniref:Uncharacterized protein n=1 Tax=viral metagenome TaxID=1070528 RepID=A0A6C0IDP6_9ZZZZ